MGTRGLTVVIEGGTHKVAQYGQWDHYPEGQGVDALKFLRDSSKVVALREGLARTRFIREDEVDGLYASVGIDPSSGWMTMADGEKFNRAFPGLSRDHGAGILEMIADADGEMLLKDDFTFAADSLFCEYAYVVDFDRMVFESYVGFQKRSHNDAGVFSALTPDGGEYATVRLLTQFPLSSLPSDDEFVRICEGVNRYYHEQRGEGHYYDDDEDAVESVEGPYIVAAEVAVAEITA